MKKAIKNIRLFTLMLAGAIFLLHGIIPHHHHDNFEDISHCCKHIHPDDNQYESQHGEEDSCHVNFDNILKVNNLILFIEENEELVRQPVVACNSFKIGNIFFSKQYFTHSNYLRGPPTA